MNEKIQELLLLIKKCNPLEGFNKTSILGLQLIRLDKVNDAIQSTQKPSLCVVIQGSKNVIVGENIYSYSPGEYIVASVEVPVTGQIIKATPKNPYYCLMLELEPSSIFEILKENPVIKSQSKQDKSGTYVNKAKPELYDAFIRLLKCLEGPSDNSFISSMIIKEIIFRVLTDTNGDVVKQMGIAGSQNQKITNAIGLIKKRFNLEVNIEELAHEIGMSPSSFHKHFKDITNMSPLQYQKLIRLQEARRLLLSDEGDAASIGFEVGYESPSQFSREYSRLFGKPPKQDIKEIKKH